MTKVIWFCLRKYLNFGIEENTVGLGKQSNFVTILKSFDDRRM